MSLSRGDSDRRIGRAKCFKVGKFVVPYWLVAVMLGSTIVLGVLGSYLTTVSVPLQVNEPLQILSYPSGWSLYPGETAKFNITVMNYAPLNYSVVLDFQASDLTYQTNYMTFSYEVYTVVPGQQNLNAWLSVAANAPGASVTVNITLARLPIYPANSSSTATIVVSSNPLWTDTGLSIGIGNTVNITASGTWAYNSTIAMFGPDGISDFRTDTFLYQANHGELIAYVGPDPYQGHWGDGSFFPQTTGYWAIGSSGQFTSDKKGELWLGFNDDAVTEATFDNSGTVTALITVAST